MSSRTHRRPLALILGLSLVLTATSACSGDGAQRDATPKANGRSVAGMLRLVPDRDEASSAVLVTLWGEAEGALDLSDLEAEGLDVDGERFQLSRLSAFARLGLGPGTFTGGAAAEQRYAALGFTPGALVAEIEAGTAPRRYFSGIGEMDEVDEDTVLDGAASFVDGATRTRVSGTDVVSWFGDDEIRPGLDTPVGPLPGQAGRVAVPDGILTFATSDDRMAASIDAVRTGEGTLAEVEPLAEAARRLDEVDAYAAYLSTDVITLPEIGSRPTSQPGTGALEPYLAIATGASRQGTESQFVVVLVHDGEQAAASNARQLAEVVAEGTSVRTGQPYAELLADPRIEQDGTVVVARFTVENPSLWLTFVLGAERLLAAS